MSTRFLLAIGVTASLFFASAATQAAEIYKWVDNQGKTHFSDRPPSADQGHPRVETLGGIPANTQKRIRELAGHGISISSVTGDDRQCLILGDSSSRALTEAFVKRLADEGIGTLSTPLPDGPQAVPGSERIELHLSLQKSVAGQVQSPGDNSTQPPSGAPTSPATGKYVPR